MVINFDEKSRKCNFDQCVYHDKDLGECRGDKDRDVCIDMALKMLGVNHADITEKNRKG